MGPNINPKDCVVRDIAEALSQRLGVSSTPRLSYVALIISGIAGTINRLIESPVNISPKHISSISLHNELKY
jgi:hypothetical protein